MSSGAVMNKGGEGSSADVWSRGIKRAADESNFTDLERFEKRLRMLSLREGRNGKRQLYAPVSNVQPTALAASRHGEVDGDERDGRRQRYTNHMRQEDGDEHMQVDDRPDRVYIHDLDAELASDCESDGERLIFLPDIEKRFSRIPQQVLTGGGDGSRELVLYSVPKSLTVDEGHDSVRKAIIEARARAREKAVEDARSRQEIMDRQYDQSGAVEAVESAHGYTNGYRDSQQDEDLDPDAMDID